MQYLQYTDKKTKALVKEAMALKDEDDAGKKGWRWLGSGGYKIAYGKGNVVVKFTSSCEVQDEVGYYLSIPSKLRRMHFARIYGYTKDRIVQQRVKKPPNRHIGSTTRNKYQAQLDYLEDVLNLTDVVFLGMNNGIHQGLVKIYDMGYETIPYSIHGKRTKKRRVRWKPRRRRK